MTPRRTLLAALAALPAPARAQPTWPDRPLRLVIPFAPGGTTDVVARLMAERLGTRLAGPVVTENRGGAGGVLGAEAVAKAAPDGTTLLLGTTGSVSITRHLAAHLPYDAETGLAPVGLIGLAPNAIVVSAAVPARTLAELRDLARRGPPLRYASAGTGATSHLAGALLAAAFGAPMEHVPYRGTGPALNDLVAGRVDLTVNALASLLPHLEAGTLRALAIAAPRRWDALPDLPTAAEAGFPGVDSATWFGLLATGGTPPARLATLHAALAAVLAEPATRRRLHDAGLDPEPSASPADFVRFLAADAAKWGALIHGGAIPTD